MKKYVFAILIASIFIVSGCLKDEDGYSLGNYWVGFGIFHETDGGSYDYQIVMDNGAVLFPISIGFNIHNYVEDGDRVLVNYSVLDDNATADDDPTEFYIQLNSVKKILMKGILDITEENEDSIGNDPIIVQDVWLTDSLLNFEIKYWGNNKIHFINLVKQPGELDESVNQPIELELRHNNNDDDESIPYNAFVSFQLRALQIENLDSVQFRVTGFDYDGDEFDYDGFYHYGENSD